MQSDIASRVAQALGVALGAGEEKRLSEKPTQNLAAYDAFLKGGLEKPRRRRAARPEKGAGFLRAGRGAGSRLFARRGRKSRELTRACTTSAIPRPEVAERARQAAERTVALAPNRPRSGIWLSATIRTPSGRTQVWARRPEYSPGRQRLAPGNAELLASTAVSEEILGRWESSVDHFRQAERLDPRSVLTPGSARCGACSC